MHVLCPSCATEYEIPPILRPRKLRCASCATEWRELPPTAPEPVRSAGATPAPTPTDASVPPEPEPCAELGVGPDARAPLSPAADTASGRVLQRSRGFERADAVLLGLWIVSIAIIVLGLFVAWHWRGTIGHRWPPSLRLYRLLPGGALA